MANEEYRPPKGRVIPKSRAVFQIVLRGKAATSPRQVLPDRPGGERARRRHQLRQPADQDGGRGDQQVSSSTEGWSFLFNVPLSF